MTQVDPTSTQADPNTITSATDSTSAKAILDNFFNTLGLGSLGDWAWQKWQAGESVDQIKLESEQTPEYQARYPAMAALKKSGQAITEGQYISLENSYKQIAQAAGLPQGFYDTPDDFTKLITNNVAPTEYQQRVNDYQQIAYQAPQAVRDQLQNLYGVSPGELTAFFIDPDKALPVIQQRFNAAQAAGAAQTTGFGQLTQAQAEMVGNQGLTQDQLNSGFNKLGTDNPLFNPLTGTTEGAISTDTALNAQFNQNADDQRTIQQRQDERLAAFKGSDQFAQGKTGAAGIGTAQ